MSQKLFVEFRQGTDGFAAEASCRETGMTCITYTTNSPNGGVRVEGEVEGDAEAFVEAVKSRSGGVEFAGKAG